MRYYTLKHDAGYDSDGHLAAELFSRVEGILGRSLEDEDNTRAELANALKLARKDLAARMSKRPNIAVSIIEVEESTTLVYEDKDEKHWRYVRGERRVGERVWKNTHDERRVEFRSCK